MRLAPPVAQLKSLEVLVFDGVRYEHLLKSLFGRRRRRFAHLAHLTVSVPGKLSDLSDLGDGLDLPRLRSLFLAFGETAFPDRHSWRMKEAVTGWQGALVWRERARTPRLFKDRHPAVFFVRGCTNDEVRAARGVV